MNIYLKLQLPLLIILFTLSIGLFAGEKRTTVYMAGDSTMAIKDVKDYPETGWGVPFATFFNDAIEVRNYAQNGRSTRTFIDDGLWQGIIDHLQPGDYVFIQFGHNDEAVNKRDRYTPPEDYRANLTRFIEDSRKLIRALVSITACGLMPLPAPVSARAGVSPWHATAGILDRISPPAFPGRDFMVTEFGAAGDGVTVNTRALLLAEGDWTPFLTRPYAAVFSLAFLLVIVVGLWRQITKRIRPNDKLPV